MKLASIVPAVVGAFLFISWLNAPKEIAVDPNAPKIAWVQKDDAEKAIAQAKADKKPVLVDFGATWCKACMELEEQTFPDARVRSEAARFVTVHVDATDDDDPVVKKLSTQYKIVGLPVLLFIDSEGKEVTRFNEFVPPEKFVGALKNVK